MGVAFSTPSPIMLVYLLLACFLSAAQASGHEQVHVSGSTGPTVVGSGHTPVYAPHYYGYGHAPVYASHYYPSYPVRHAYSANPNYKESKGRDGYSSDYAHTPVYPYGHTPVYPTFSYPRYPYSYVPVAATYGYGNVNHATGTPYIYSRQPADIPYGEQEARQEYSSYAPTYAPAYISPYYRYHYSYVPAAATHGYGNVNHATGTPYIYSRYPADIPYGEQEARQEYSSYTPAYAPAYVSPYHRHHYSYVPAAATHGYGNVNHATGTPYIYSRQPADIPYGQQEARQEYSYYTSTPVYS